MSARSFQHTLVGVFGKPVAENPTQAMMEAAFADLGLFWRYLSVEVQPADLAVAVQGARAMGWRGFNLTMPHKVAVIPLLDRQSAEAETIGAVNCVTIEDGRLLGENTDGKGFLESLTPLCDPRGLDILLLGAGGAARAIAVELALAGARRICIANRSAHRAQELAAILTTRTPVAVEILPDRASITVPRETRVVVNATSIGLFPNLEHVPPLDFSSLRPSTLVCDVIPNPPRTRFLAEAEKIGCPTLDGLGMLVNQGVIGLRIWSGLEPNPSVMRAALEAVFSTP